MDERIFILDYAVIEREDALRPAATWRNFLENITLREARPVGHIYTISYTCSVRKGAKP